jgi:putative restriction endonuclease
MFGVFVHREDSRYEDHPTRKYQFPSSYLSRATQFDGGWVLYYEPTKVRNSRGYYAAAKLQKIVSDPTVANMHFAIIEPGSYFEFTESVPFKNVDGLLERGLYNDVDKISGRAQAAVRPISEDDFNRILDLGIQGVERPLPRQNDMGDTMSEDQAIFENPEERRRQAMSGSRLVRDPKFRQLVLNAYDERSSITDLKIINGGGRAEVEAAHIWPVEENGPDSIQNGIALSGTVHWMFDRGLLSLADNMEIMLSRHINDRESIESLIRSSGYAATPADPRHAPHPFFLNWHRENRFKT